MRKTQYAIGLLVLLLAIPLSIIARAQDEAAAAPTVDDRGIALEARQYLVEKYFPGADSMDMSIDSAAEIMRVPDAIIADIGKVEWEAGQLDKFAANKLYVLVKCPDGTHAIHFRDGKMRNDQLLDASRERVLRRLYSSDLYTASPAKELWDWQTGKYIDTNKAFVNALTLVMKQHEVTLDGDTVERAYANYTADKTNTKELAHALDALGKSEHAAVNCWAALWLISRMDRMSFNRETRQYDVPDLQAVDAQAFYENVFYAVKAREELPWGHSASDNDFLQFVLSPRGSGEPLQRWRRHMWDALSPEVVNFTRDDMPKAIEIANHAYGDYFQYEGDTTWEDFGMLTSLAVHEGRCEDCSNVLNIMLWTLGIPACQAYTPWWGHADGNHAWTWVRGAGPVPGDGINGVKVYVKTWDGKEDVTKEYSPVTTVRNIAESSSEIPAQLMVWNSDEWRTVAQADVAKDEVVFENVGCRLNFALLVRVALLPDRIADVRTDGSVRWMNVEEIGKESGEAFTAALDAKCALGEFAADKTYALQLYTNDGWKDVASEHTDTGGMSFAAHPDRLYRITGEGISARPFTVEMDGEGKVVVLVR